MANNQVDLTFNEYMTLSDIMKATNGGKHPLSLIMDEYKKPLTLGADIPACEASDKFEDMGFFAEPWEFDKVTDTTDLDGGSKYYKTGTYARKDIMGMRSTAIGINERNYLASGANGDLWRAQQTFQRVKHLALDMEHDMFYGDPMKDPNQGLGLMPRFSILTDEDGEIKHGAHAGELSPYVTIDGSQGSITSSNASTYANKLGSIYLIHLSSTDGVCWLYPKDSYYTAGVRYRKGKFQDVNYEKNGETYVKSQASDIFEQVGGIGMKSRKSAIRIANIDFKSQAGLDNFDKALYQAFEAVPTEFQSSILIYAPKRCIADLKQYYRNKMIPNVNTYDGAKPMNLKGDFSIDGMMFRRCEQLTLKESYIA